MLIDENAILKLSNSTIRRFIKDYKFPCKGDRPEMFIHAIKSIYPDYDFIDQVKDFVDIVSTLGENEFKDHGGRIVAAGITSINLDKFNEVTQDLVSGFKNIGKDLGSKIMNPHCDGKEFISFDLIKANWNVFKTFAPEVLSSTWEEYSDFAASFTPYPYFINSSQIRYAIFGNINPKRQQLLQQHVVQNDLIKNIEELTNTEIIQKTSDEVIIPDNKDIREELKSIAQSCRMPCRMTPFKINRIGQSDYYYQTFEDGKIKLMGVPGHLFLQALKFVQGKKVMNDDLIFIFEGQAVKFCDPFLFDDPHRALRMKREDN